MKQADAVVILSRAVDALDAMRDKIRSDGGRTRRPQSLAVYEAFVGRLVEETKSGYAALLKRLFARRDANASGDGPLAAKQCRAVLRDFLAQLPRLAADSISSVARAAVSQLAELVSDGSIADGLESTGLASAAAFESLAGRQAIGARSQTLLDAVVGRALAHEHSLLERELGGEKGPLAAFEAQEAAVFAEVWKGAQKAEGDKLKCGEFCDLLMVCMADVGVGAENLVRDTLKFLLSCVRFSGKERVRRGWKIAYAGHKWVGSEMSKFGAAVVLQKYWRGKAARTLSVACKAEVSLHNIRQKKGWRRMNEEKARLVECMEDERRSRSRRRRIRHNQRELFLLEAVPPEKLQKFHEWRKRRGATIIQRVWRKCRFASFRKHHRQRQQATNGRRVPNHRGLETADGVVGWLPSEPVKADSAILGNDWPGPHQEVGILRLSEMQQKFVRRSRERQYKAAIRDETARNSIAPPLRGVHQPTASSRIAGRAHASHEVYGCFMRTRAHVRASQTARENARVLRQLQQKGRRDRWVRAESRFRELTNPVSLGEVLVVGGGNVRHEGVQERPLDPVATSSLIGDDQLRTHPQNETGSAPLQKSRYDDSGATGTSNPPRRGADFENTERVVRAQRAHEQALASLMPAHEWTLVNIDGVAHDIRECRPAWPFTTWQGRVPQDACGEALPTGETTPRSAPPVVRASRDGPVADVVASRRWEAFAKSGIGGQRGAGHSATFGHENRGVATRKFEDKVRQDSERIVEAIRKRSKRREDENPQVRALTPSNTRTTVSSVDGKNVLFLPAPSHSTAPQNHVGAKSETREQPVVGPGPEHALLAGHGKEGQAEQSTTKLQIRGGIDESKIRKREKRRGRRRRARRRGEQNKGGSGAVPAMNVDMTLSGKDCSAHSELMGGPGSGTIVPARIGKLLNLLVSEISMHSSKKDVV